MSYYYLDANNTVQGPHPVAELLCMLSEDQITLSTLIAEEGGDEWREIRTMLSSLSTTARPPSILQPAHLPIEDQKNNTEYLYSEHKDMVIISVFLSSLIGGFLLYFGVRKNSKKLANLAALIGILSMLVWLIVIYSTILVGGSLNAFPIIIITLGIILSCSAYEAINKRRECPKWWRFGRYGAVCFSFSVIAVSWLFFPVTKEERRANINEIHHAITGVEKLYSSNRVIKSNKKRSHKEALPHIERQEDTRVVDSNVKPSLVGTPVNLSRSLTGSSYSRTIIKGVIEEQRGNKVKVMVTWIDSFVHENYSGKRKQDAYRSELEPYGYPEVQKGDEVWVPLSIFE